MMIELGEWASLIMFRDGKPMFVKILFTDQEQRCTIDTMHASHLVWDHRDKFLNRDFFSADAVAFHEVLAECVFYPKEMINVILKFSKQRTFIFDLRLTLSSFGAAMENVGYGLKISNTSYKVNAIEKVEVKEIEIPGIIAVLRKDIISTSYRSQIDVPKIGSVIHLASCTLDSVHRDARIQSLQLQFGGYGANGQFNVFEKFPGWFQELLICRGAHIGVSEGEYVNIFAELNRISIQ